jgi:THO complex subunit 3
MVASADAPFADPFRREIVGHRKSIRSVAWNVAGRKLASGSVDHTARVYDVEHGVRGGRDVELKGHGDAVEHVCWDPTSPSALATISSDKTLRLWDVRSGSSCVATVATAGDPINVVYRPDGAVVAVGDRDDVISFVDARTREVLRTHKFPREVNELAWDAEGATLYCTTGQGTVEVLAYPDLKPLRTIEAHTHSVYCVAFDHERHRYALGSADALVSIWDAAEDVCLRTIARVESPVRSVAFSRDGRFVAAGGEDARIDVARVSDGARECAIATGGVTESLAWSPTEMLLAYAAEEKPEDGGRAREGVIVVWGAPDTI